MQPDHLHTYVSISHLRPIHTYLLTYTREQTRYIYIYIYSITAIYSKLSERVIYAPELGTYPKSRPPQEVQLAGYYPLEYACTVYIYIYIRSLDTDTYILVHT